jgi:hypothetical protein
MAPRRADSMGHLFATVSQVLTPLKTKTMRDTERIDVNEMQGIIKRHFISGKGWGGN